MKINPYLEFYDCKEAVMVLESIQFEITNFACYEHENGFISIQVDWDAKGENAFKVKFPTDDGYMFTINSIEKQFKFKALSFKYDDDEVGAEKSYVSFSVGLEFEEKKDYTYLFYRNTGYGVVVYFAPYGWAKEETKKLIFQQKGQENV